MKYRKLNLDDFNKLAKLFANHLFYLPQDKFVDKSSSEKVAKRLFRHYILSTPLNFLGLNIFINFVAQTKDGKIIGTITARRYPLARSWIIGPVVCHRDFTRRGIGTKLMKLILAYLKKNKATIALVSTARNNEKGLIFFEKFGFKYIDHNFLQHEVALNYERKISIKYGYFQQLSGKIQLVNSPNTELDSRPTKKSKMWYILLKTIDN